MAGEHDVLGIRAGLKDHRTREAIANAISPGSQGTAERHVFIRVDGNETIGSVNHFVLDEPAGSQAEGEREACPSVHMRDHGSAFKPSPPASPRQARTRAAPW